MYDDVNALVTAMLDGVRGVLENDLVAMYLTGSLAWGGYEPGASDIDLLVVIERDLTDAQFAALRTFHARLGESAPPLSKRIDAPYLSRAIVADDSRRPFPMVDSSALSMIPYSTEIYFDRHIAYERGHALYGPPSREVMASVTPDQLREATRDLLAGPWARNLLPEQEEWLRPRHRQAFAVLSMCRALHTLETGELLSKPDAAAWALRAVDARWHSLIERALPWRFDRTEQDPGETQAFMRYVIETSGKP